MSLLELRDVCKRHNRSGRTVTVLEHASLLVDPGELVAVWGLRGSGRTTLLRLAAGIDTPDAGAVLFAGRDLAEYGDALLGRELAYSQSPLRGPGRSAVQGAVQDEVLLKLLVNGLSGSRARARVTEALTRAGAEGLATRDLAELDGAQRARVAIASALAMRPRLLAIDEPVAGVDLHQRDEILLLLRSLADFGTSILMTVGDTTGLTGSDQALTIGDGELRGSSRRPPAPVTELDHWRRAEAG